LGGRGRGGNHIGEKKGLNSVPSLITLERFVSSKEKGGWRHREFLPSERKRKEEEDKPGKGR